MEPAKKLEAAIGYEFADQSLLTRALTHRSKGAANNERLEFLGDSYLGFVVADLLFEAFPDAPEGVLTRFRASLVNQGSLAKLARELKLGEFLLLGPGELKSGGFDRDSILSDAFESIVGAIYRDGGVHPARDFLTRLYRPIIAELDASRDDKDPKTRLQEVLAAVGKPAPRYDVTEITGPPHDRRFTVNCFIKEVDEPFKGFGRSRRQAEQVAAALALEHPSIIAGVAS